METAPKTDSAGEYATAPRVEFAGDVLKQIRQHARGSMSAEICGVLIGREAGGVTHIDACIAGEKASQGGAHVTFTQETWEHIYKVKDARFAGEAIVGWYHSHPGFGIFLSDYDLFIHENFFDAAHQVAWVFDPHSDEEGCFGWVEKKVRPLTRITVIREARENAVDVAIEKPQTKREAGSKRPPRRSVRGAVSVALLITALATSFLAGHFAGSRLDRTPRPASKSEPRRSEKARVPVFIDSAARKNATPNPPPPIPVDPPQ